MPLFGSLFMSMLGGLATFFASFLTRKVAVVAAAVTTFGALMVGALLAFNVAMVPILGNLFATSYGQFLGLAFPPAAGQVMAILGANWAAVALFQWQRQALLISVQA